MQHHSSADVLLQGKCILSVHPALQCKPLQAQARATASWTFRWWCGQMPCSPGRGHRPTSPSHASLGTRWCAVSPECHPPCRRPFRGSSPQQSGPQSPQCMSPGSLRKVAASAALLAYYFYPRQRDSDCHGCIQQGTQGIKCSTQCTILSGRCLWCRMLCPQACQGMQC